MAEPASRTRGAGARCHRLLDSPLGTLCLVGDAAGRLVEVRFPGPEGPDRPRDAVQDGRALDEAARQLEEYFAGRRQRFELVLAVDGTPFQRRVWGALRQIPFARTASYAEVAVRIGRATAARAVGAANRKNPLPIVVPCHRVVGADGRLIGFAGGLERKAWLLRHEARVAGAGHRAAGLAGA